jgi:uncharacterized iron-regulated membrane protein
MMNRTALYRTIWRWHFYAGLFVLPFILILAASGAAYLFKPQIDRWEEAAFRNLDAKGAVSANMQLATAIEAHPGSEFHHYRLPEAPGDAAVIHLALADGKSMRDVFVSPQGRVLGSIDPESRITNLIAKFHGSLFAGSVGDMLVELAASWAIVMVLTGLFLWWPEGRGLAGVARPRFALKGRGWWKDLHAVTGFWVSGLVLALLLSGLPWAGIWGQAFRMVRAEMGWVAGPQNWKVGAGDNADPHAEHDHQAMLQKQAAGVPLTSLDAIVHKAKAEKMAFPVLVVPPSTPQRFGPPTGMVWTVKSEAQNRPLIRSVTYDLTDGSELSRSGFADKHVIDRAINYGIAWHEGQLFGWFNQLVGLVTAIGLWVLAISGFVMWRRRRPADVLGAPPLPELPRRVGWITGATILLALLLPLLALSLIVLFAFERLALPFLPKLSRWLGIAPNM